MIKFNLLPPEDKKRLEALQLSRLALFLAVWFFVLFLIFLILLATNYFYLLILVQAQEEAIKIEGGGMKSQRLTAIEDKIKESNQLIEAVYLKEKQGILFTPLLEELSQLVPSGLYLTSFSYDQTSQRIQINGWAGQRQSLLAFQAKLKASPVFVQIESPLSNLLKEKEIDFSFSFKPADLAEE